MSQANVDTVQERLSALRGIFAAQLPQKLGKMRELMERLRAQGWAKTPGEDLHRMLHNLAGTAGTMGYTALGAQARAIEKRLNVILEVPAEWPVQADALVTAFAQLEGLTMLSQHQPIVEMPVDASGAAPMKILAVDDDPVSQALLVSFLSDDGHTVVTATDGAEAVSRFETSRPDLVLMDVVMPNMDGYEAARRIKAACGKQFVPLIFLTALNDEQELARCVAAGGDDFIVKPYNRILLRAKLIAMQRIRELHREVAIHQQRTADEITLSKHVYEAITDRNPKLPAVRFRVSAVGHFSGDAVLFAQSPCGRLMLMLGDFTGHGLAAALGALPTADMFYDLVGDEISLPDLALALNRKLKSILPMGRFCAALLIEIDPRADYVQVWNGGIPGAYLLDPAGRILQRLSSDKLPLAVIGDQGFDTRVQRHALAPGAQILLFTDGVNEVRNARGEMLTLAGAEALLQGDDAYASLQAGIAAYLGGKQAEDDITIVAIDPARLAAPGPA